MAPLQTVSHSEPTLKGAPAPFVSVVIVSLNGGGVIGRALNSLREDGYANKEVLVVDNGSTDDLADVVRRDHPRVRLIQSPVNLGFAGGNNLGIRYAEGDIVVLLNDDTEVLPGWLDALVRASQSRPHWGVMGCKLLYPDGKTIQHAGGYIDPNANTHHIGYEQPDDGRFDQLIACDYVTGAAFAIRRGLLDKIGPLDDQYFPIYFEETDYCFQTRMADCEVLYVPDAVVIHHESRTQARYSFRFIYRYNCGRLRFLLKCYPARALVRAARCELCWWFRPYSYECYWPVFRAYLRTIPRLPAYWKARKAFWRKMRALGSKAVSN
jgi:GT2 family glycosyltransferase